METIFSNTYNHPAAQPVAANPTADSKLLATIGEFSQRAAKLSNDREVSVAFSILEEALRRRAKPAAVDLPRPRRRTI